MKRLLALLLAVVMVFALAACSTEETKTTEAAKTTEKTQETEVATTPAETEAVTEPATEESEIIVEETEPEEDFTDDTTVMTFADFMEAEEETYVVIECAVQANQSWWDNKITVYGADENGGYFLYEMACSEEDSAKLTQGTWIRVTGVKKEWEGMIEIMDATFTFVEKEAYIAEAQDVTALIDSEELVNKTALPVIFTGMTVEAIEFKNGEPGDDIYVTVKSGETSYNFCVERYLTGPETEVYAAVSALQAGDVIDITAYLYWYQGINPHIIAVTAA